jgi:hypothetical protein
MNNQEPKKHVIYLINLKGKRWVAYFVRPDGSLDNVWPEGPIAETETLARQLGFRKQLLDPNFPRYFWIPRKAGYNPVQSVARQIAESYCRYKGMYGTVCFYQLHGMYPTNVANIQV